MSLGYRDPKWQRKRLERFNAAGWTCTECGGKQSELNLHHYWYEDGRDVWDYPDECFAVLCAKCHKSWHDKKKHLDMLCKFTLTEMDQAIGLLSGLQCVLNKTDFLFTKDMDALVVVAVLRGFWLPIDYQKLVIDESLERVGRGETFLLSSVVQSIIPMELHQFTFLADWLQQAQGRA